MTDVIGAGGPASTQLQASWTAQSQQRQDALIARAKSGQQTLVSPEEATRIGKEFEALFLSQMIEHMWAGIETDGLLGGGNAERIFRSFAIEEYSKSFSERGGIGIADAVQRSLLQMQEAYDPLNDPGKDGTKAPATDEVKDDETG